MSEIGWRSGSRSTEAAVRAVAYRTLGSLSEADDAVQEARSTTMSSTVFVCDRGEAEIELRETLRVEKSIDLDDLPVRDGEGHH
jgi:hypothetical protein